MAKIVCRICGKVEDSDRYIPDTKKSIELNECCFRCLHWHDQMMLDAVERGEHKWAVINGTHYVLCEHTDAEVFRGYGGHKFKIRFNDGYETICDNLWCQGDIPEGYWRELKPDNAKFINEW